jgi:uncharacterized protein (TIGR02452 family)
MNRTQRAQLAQATLKIIDSGGYSLPDGSQIDIGDAVSRAISGTIHYSPENFADVRAQCKNLLAERNYNTRFQVVNSTTFAAARALTMQAAQSGVSVEASETAPYAGVMSLNFASAKNPGGGFLKGSQAQEECLARASALYRCIDPVQEYYEINRSCKTALYTEHMIYSPAVPVFRDDDDVLIDDPWCTSIITSPAVNFGALKKNHPDLACKTAEIMRGRIENVLSVAVVGGCRSVVLGAWGCGVFKNDPAEMSAWFHEMICDGGTFASAFENVVFAVLDGTEQRRFIEPFEKQFASELEV